MIMRFERYRFTRTDLTTDYKVAHKKTIKHCKISRKTFDFLKQIKANQAGYFRVMFKVDCHFAGSTG